MILLSHLKHNKFTFSPQAFKNIWADSDSFPIPAFLCRLGGKTWHKFFHKVLRGGLQSAKAPTATFHILSADWIDKAKVKKLGGKSVWKNCPCTRFKCKTSIPTSIWGTFKSLAMMSIKNNFHCAEHDMKNTKAKGWCLKRGLSALQFHNTSKTELGVTKEQLHQSKRN